MSPACTENISECLWATEWDPWDSEPHLSPHCIFFCEVCSYRQITQRQTMGKPSSFIYSFGDHLLNLNRSINCMFNNINRWYTRVNLECTNKSKPLSLCRPPGESSFLCFTQETCPCHTVSGTSSPRSGTSIDALIHNNQFLVLTRSSQTFSIIISLMSTYKSRAMRKAAQDRSQTALGSRLSEISGVTLKKKKFPEQVIIKSFSYYEY